MAFSPRNPNGQAAMADSAPVVIASNQTAIPVSSATLATAAKQPALGTAGSASADVITVQGITSMTPLKTDSSGVTQPVSGTVTANAGTNLNTSALATESGGNLAAIKAKTDNIPAQGQALAAASTPVVLTAIQVAALTPPAAITGFATETTLSAQNTLIGAVTETAPASDTASSGLSGRLQRIAQRLTSLITALGSPFQAGGSIGNTSFAATQATGTNLHTVVDSGTITAVTAITNALPAGTNGIGKLTANSGVDIGDVDVTSLPALASGTNNIGQVSVAPQTANGLSVLNATSSDGGTALTNTAQAIKASAGQVYGWFIYNPNATAQFVQIYNTAAGSVTVGTTNPLFMLTIPATSGANVEFTNGITFSNAGFSCAATSTAGGNGAPGTALDAVIFYK